MSIYRRMLRAVTKPIKLTNVLVHQAAPDSSPTVQLPNTVDPKGQKNEMGNDISTHQDPAFGSIGFFIPSARNNEVPMHPKQQTYEFQSKLKCFSGTFTHDQEVLNTAKHKLQDAYDDR